MWFLDTSKLESLLYYCLGVPGGTAENKRDTLELESATGKSST